MTDYLAIYNRPEEVRKLRDALPDAKIAEGRGLLLESYDGGKSWHPSKKTTPADPSDLDP